MLIDNFLLFDHKVRWLSMWYFHNILRKAVLHVSIVSYIHSLSCRTIRLKLVTFLLRLFPFLKVFYSDQNLFCGFTSVHHFSTPLLFSS